MAGFRCASLAAATLTAACATGPMMTVETDRAGATGGAPVTYGGLQAPESVVYDAANDRYFVANLGGFGPENDGYISIVSPSGATIERKWAAGSETQELRDPLGTAIHNDSLYVADGSSIRLFDLETGMQTHVMTVAGASGFNDLAIARDGTVYATETGMSAPETGAIHKITPDGVATVLARGESLGQPNGIELDADGNVVFVGLATTDVTIMSPVDGSVLGTIALPGDGNDGLIIIEDGGMIVSSVFSGVLYAISPEGEASVLAEGVTLPASIALDPVRRRVVIPQLLEHSLTFLPL